MKKHNAFKEQSFFSVLETHDDSQIATMILQPGQWSGKKGNEHAGSEQTLLVIEGEVVAEIGDDRDILTAGDVVVVPRGVAHRFGNVSDRVARTFNVYAPPAY